MKKVILGAAALIFCAVGHAQVTQNDGDTSPTAYDVPALPGAAGSANTGLSIQNGNDNKVRVRQAGTRMSVYTVQSDGNGTGGNLAAIRQTGNVTGLSGLRNLAEVQQKGTTNQSVTRQEGDRNESVTHQGLIDTGSESNKARIQQGTGNQAERNYGAITQDGDRNQGKILQTHDNSDAWIQQDGDDNWSRVVQNAGPNGSAGHYAMVDQEGDENDSDINQSGAGARNIAEAVQLGNGNYAKQIQTTDATSGPGNEALVNQGDDSSLPSAGTSLVSSMYSDLNAVDNISNGTFSGNSYNGIAFQTQNGSRNDAEIHQFGADLPTAGNYAEQNQDGFNDDAFIVQNAYGNPAGGGNYARQDQDELSSNSEAGIAQNGFGHKAYQRQTGNNNSALSTQRGDGNKVNTYQDGNRNRATTAQRGEDNKILLVQRGGHSYSVQQNLPGMLGGVGGANGGNWADILQLGPSGNFTTDGIDCVFEPEMLPMATPSLGNLTITDPCPDC